MKYLSIIAFTLLLFACYGWGYALVRRTTLRDKDDFAFLSAVGVAFLVFLGGVLNLVRLAYPVALSILLLSGLIFFVIHCSENAKMWLATWRTGNLFSPKKLKSMTGHFLPMGILITAIGFYALTLLPIAAFTHYSDDSMTYVPRSLRMVQAGTMAGNPFGLLGIDLGAQAFLNGFALIGFPIEYLGGFDAVFSFALAGLLLIAIGKKFDLHWIYTVFALLGFIIINPQTGNISSLYTGSAIILGILFASCRLIDQMEKSDTNAIPVISVGILGLLFACLIALKTTFASYVAAYFTLFFTGLLLVSKNKLTILKLCSIFTLVAFLALLPWLALHTSNYMLAIHAALHPNVAAKGEIPLHNSNISILFTTGNLRHGDSYLSYGIIELMLFMMGCYSLFNTFGNRFSPSQRGYFLVAAASCAAAVVSYLFNGFVFAPPPAIRYSCPVILACLPFAWMAVSMAVSNTPCSAKSLNLSGMKMALILSMPLLVAILFWNTFVSRIERAYDQHMPLSVPVSDTSIEHYKYASSPDARKITHEIQYLTQPAQKIFAWIAMPAHLDFSRNEIYSFSAVCLLDPWVNMPLNGNVDDMIQYLKSLGIRYIMWEYGKESMVLENRHRQWLLSPVDNYRIMGGRALYLSGMLPRIMKGGRFLYNEDGMVLFDLQQLE